MTSSHGPVAVGARWIMKAVSFAETSIQVSDFSPAWFTVPVRSGGTSGGNATEIGRIMSISSWLRMWQCHTYSHRS